MIKLPKDVSNIIKVLADKGHVCYAVGGCVRDSLIGEVPLDWDLATDAGLEVLKETFPDAKVISDKYSVVRLDFTTGEEDDESPVVDIATFRVDGEYLDHRRPDTVEFTTVIEDDLKRRDFTINGMADNPERGFVDPFAGKDDIAKKLVRAIGDPKVRFEEDPIRMLRAIRIAAEKGFDVQKVTYEAMLAKAALLEKCSVDKIREEFCRILASPNAGKGLRMLAGADLMPYIIGDAALKLNARQRAQFSTLCDNIDRTKQILLRRLCLFYSCLEDKKGEKAMNMLNYDSKTQMHILDGLYRMERLHFIKKDPELKAFLVEFGLERYEQMNYLAKAQRIIFDSTDTKIMSRHYMMKRFEESGEPIFIEDLAVDGDDLIEAGICQGEAVGNMLMMLTDVVHKKPADNEKEILLKFAKKFSKNKFAASTRRVKWLK